MDFLAVRSTSDGTPSVDASCLHHFDVVCPKCGQTYGFWGPLPVLEEQLRQAREDRLTQFLTDVCPFHKNSFQLPALEGALP